MDVSIKNTNSVNYLSNEGRERKQKQFFRAKVSSSRFRILQGIGKILNNLMSINYNITLRSDKQSFFTEVKIWIHSKRQRAGFGLRCQHFEEQAIALENAYQELLKGPHPLSENDQKIFAQINEKIAILSDGLLGPLSNKGLIVISEQLKRWLRIKEGFVREFTMHLGTFSLNQPESDQSKIPVSLHPIFTSKAAIWELMQTAARYISSMVNEEKATNYILSGLVFKNIDDYISARNSFYALLKNDFFMHIFIKLMANTVGVPDFNEEFDRITGYDCIGEIKSYEKFAGKLPSPYPSPLWHSSRKNDYQKLLYGRDENGDERKYPPITEKDLPRIAQLSGQSLQEVKNEYVYYKTLEFMMDQFRHPTFTNSLSPEDGIHFCSHGSLEYNGFVPVAQEFISPVRVEKMDDQENGLISGSDNRYIKGKSSDQLADELIESGLNKDFKHIILSNCHGANRHEISNFKPETLEEARLPRGGEMPTGLDFMRALFKRGFENAEVTSYPGEGFTLPRFPNESIYNGSAFVQSIERKCRSKCCYINSDTAAQIFTKEDLKGVPAGVPTERF